MKIGVTKLDISLPALMSILALVILVGISCVNEDLNVGFLGIAFGIIVGGVFGGTPATKIMNAFPLSLFMILVGVTFLLVWHKPTAPWKNSLLIPFVSAKATLL